MFAKVIISSLLLVAAGMDTVSGAPIKRDIEDLEKKDIGSDILSVVQEVQGVITNLAPVADSIIKQLPPDVAAPAASILNVVTQDLPGVIGFVTSIVGEFVPQATPQPGAPTSAVALPGTPLQATTVQLQPTPPAITAGAPASTVNLLQTPQGTPLVRPPAQAAQVGGAIINPTFQMVTIQPTPTTTTATPTGSYPAAPPSKRDIGDDIQNVLNGLGGAVPEIASVANQFISILPSGLAGPASSLLNVATSDAGLLFGSATAAPTSTGATPTASSTASASATASVSASSTSSAPSSTASSGASRLTLSAGAAVAGMFAVAFIAL